jgi:AcrR family transcriptional regulator
VLRPQRYVTALFTRSWPVIAVRMAGGACRRDVSGSFHSVRLAMVICSLTRVTGRRGIAASVDLRVVLLGGRRFAGAGNPVVRPERTTGAAASSGEPVGSGARWRGPGAGASRCGAPPRSPGQAVPEAARIEFAECGFDRPTVRAIGERAGVDAAMVNHFGGKDALFDASIIVPVQFDQVVAAVLDGPRAQVGDRLARTVIGIWDRHAAEMAVLIRNVTANESSTRLIRQFVEPALLGPLVGALEVDHPDLRVALCGSQIVGLAVARFVLQLEPVAHPDAEVLVAALAPTLQRYLAGPLGIPRRPGGELDSTAPARRPNVAGRG